MNKGKISLANGKLDVSNKPIISFTKGDELVREFGEYTVIIEK